MAVAMMTSCFGGVGFAETIAAPLAIEAQPTSATEFTLSQNDVVMKVGETVALTATPVSGAALGDIAWGTSDPDVATVTDGVITAVGAGDAIITATSGGMTVNCAVQVDSVVTKLTLSAEKLSLKVGETGNLAATADGDLTNISWRSMDEKVATVVQGTVTAVGAGNTTVYAVCDGVMAACQVTVSAELIAIELTPATVSLTEGETVRLSAAPNAGAELGDISWTSSNADVATVENGKVTAVAPGTAVIMVSSGGIVDTCTVTVNAKLTALEMNLRELSLEVNRTAALTVAANEGAVLGSVTWTSSDESVARVVDGKVTAVGQGQATITAMSGNRAASCTVTVYAPLTGISLDAQTADMLVGETRALKVIPNEGANADNATWTSSNTAVANVQDGVVTALGVGEVTITAVCGNYHATCKITITAPLTQITLNSTEVQLEEGKELLLVATPNEGASLTGAVWTSSDETVATVEDGKVKAVSAGTAIITIACGEISASCTVTVKEYVPPVEVLESDGMLYVGETLKLDYRYNYSAQEPLRSATWSVSDSGIATIDSQTGVLTGVAPGTVKATITCSTTNWKTYTAEVEVKVGLRVIGIALDNVLLEMELNDEQQLKATLSPDGAVGEIEWSSSNPAVATVSDDGVVKAVGAGSATITASCDGFTASCNVKVEVKATGIALFGENMVLYPKQKGTIRCEIQPANTTDKTIAWVSSDPTIATVTASGIVQGVAEGECTITGTTANGISVTVQVSIVPKGQAVTSLKLSKSKLTISRTQSVTLTAKASPSKAVDKSVTWAVQDPSIATVDENGVVTGVAPGKTTVMAVSTSGVYKTCKVTVKPLAVAKVTLSQTAATLKSGDTLQLSCTLAPENADDLRVRWSSSKSSVASVDPETGLVTARKNGTAYITCKSISGKTAKCKITVQAITPVLDRSKLTMIMGESFTIPVTFSPATADEIPVKWTTSKPSVAAVNAQGVITAMSPGTATITVTAISGKKDTCKVTVKPVLVTDVQLSNPYGDFAVGGRYKLDVSFEPENATKQTVTWKSSNKKIAKVNATTGEIICLKPGQVTIMATTTDGTKLKAYYQINIIQLDITDFRLNTESIKIKTGETYQVDMTLTGETYGIKPVWSSDNPLVASVDQNGLITGIGSGITTVRCTIGGEECAVKVTVPANSNANYRVLIAGEYTNSRVSGFLNFAANGLMGVSSVFDLANIYGDRYETLRLNNPKEGALLGNIATFFADADSDDISVLYLLSHATIVNGQYRWLIAGSSAYITEAELTSVLEDIDGKVVLVLVSCRAGQYLEEYTTSDAAASLKGVLSSVNGSRPTNNHINIITSNAYDLRGAYTDLPKDQSFDFFSRVFNEALGWDQLNQKPFEKVFSDTNNDGVVTLKELVEYLDANYQADVDEHIEKYGESSVKVNKVQQIEYYLTDPDLVIYSRNRSTISEK